MNRKALKGGFSFAGRKARPVELRANMPDRYLEANHQEAIIDWKRLTISLIRHSHPEQAARLRWLHSSLNGVFLGATQTRKAVASGMTAGVPDLTLPCVKRDAEGAVCYSGLFVEMKRRGGGRLSPEQKEFAAHAQAEGYRCVVCFNWQEAAREIVAYLGLEKHAPIMD